MSNHNNIRGFCLSIGILSFAGILRAQSVASPQKAANPHAPLMVTADGRPVPYAAYLAKKAVHPASNATIATHQMSTLTPNPASNDVKCAWTGGAREIALIDELGNIVHRYSPATTASSLSITAQGLPKGNYYVRITFSNGTVETHPLAVE